MASVFEVLDEVRKRPGMYVGGDDTARALQLQNLEQMLCGYSLALRQHRIEEPVTDFIREFGEYLRKTKGWSTSCGPVVAIIGEAGGDSEAWELFWSLVDEFRTTVEARH
jgi:hypothetical protein